MSATDPATSFSIRFLKKSMEERDISSCLAWRRFTFVWLLVLGRPI